MSGFEPAVKELISSPDNIEIVRDQIAALLAVDLARQYELAKEADDHHAADYRVAVYVEHDAPFQYVDEETPGSNPFSCVNVSIDTTHQEKGTASVNGQRMSAQFYVDVYATGNTASDADMGTRASLKAWKTARLVRHILRAEANTYLRLKPGTVGKVRFQFQAGEPSAAQSAIRVKMVRITLGVDYEENVPVTTGEAIELIEATILDGDGAVILAF